MLDVFAGAGGLSYGLSEVGFRPIAAVELLPQACDTYAGLHPEADVMAADTRRVDFRRFRGRVRVVVGGPPCQPFSTGGLRLGGADVRDGFPEMLRILREVQPEAFLVENVAGLARGSAGAYFLPLLEAMRELDYHVDWTILAATDYGVPQRRERLFIVGSRQPGFAFPEPTHGPDRAFPWVPSGTIIDAEPFGEPNPSIVTYAKSPDLRPSPYDGHLFNGGGRPIDVAAPARTILASAGGNKTSFIDTLGVVPGYHAHLTACGAPRTGRVPGARRITVAESAALQTFPSGTRFAGSRSMQYKLVGNAVPPRLAAAVGAALAEHVSTARRSVLAA
jgi:DNA (cytosine-5)-methyltransferase 1